MLRPLPTLAALLLSSPGACLDDGASTGDLASDTATASGTDSAAQETVTGEDTATTEPDDTAVVAEDTAVAAEDTAVAAEDTAVAPNPLGAWCEGQPDNFSFFVTSMTALWKLAGSAPDDMDGGFGGDYGGLAGADELCQTIAEATGNGHKTWRAFLSVTDGGDGQPVHAIDRIGAGPWYDANGRLVATGLTGLLAGDRPDGDAQTINDLPDECGVPLSAIGDSHDVITGSDDRGELASDDPESTCMDWTSTDGTIGNTSSSGGHGGPGGGSRGTVMCGHSFPRRLDSSDGASWVSDHPVPGCSRGAVIVQGSSSGTCIGCSGGYGALYCFAR